MPQPDWSSIQEGKGGKTSRHGAERKEKKEKEKFKKRRIKTKTKIKAKQIQKREKIDKEIKRRKMEIKK